MDSFGFTGPKIIVKNCLNVTTLTDLPYNFENIPGAYSYYREEKLIGYLLEGNNRIIAREHIMRLNKFLEEARYLVEGFPDLEIADIRFDIEDYSYIKDLSFLRDFSFLRLKHEAKQVKKYPLVLCFRTVNSTRGTKEFEKNIFGEIYYLKNGHIGKIWIVCWKNHKHYSINCSLKNDYLVISKIRHNGDILYKF